MSIIFKKREKLEREVSSLKEQMSTFYTLASKVK